jgi:feruloyl esterase
MDTHDELEMKMRGSSGRVVEGRSAKAAAVVFASAAFFCLPSVEAFGANCGELVGLKLDGATITSAENVGAGPLKVSFFGMMQITSNVPAFCRVKGVAAASIGYEVWLPAQDWNGRLLSIGNAGFGGAPSTAGLADAIAKGYAATSNDTGHQGNGREWMSDPDRVRHWSRDATHLVTFLAKALISAYYGEPAKFSYFAGCSTGGAQAMEEAEFFPADYDGIVAGAPALSYTRLMLGMLWGLKAAEKPESKIPLETLKVLHSAVLKACDAEDGLSDGLVGNPLACHYDPAELTCKSGETKDCLTPAQVETARLIYQGARNARTGEAIQPGLAYGSEADPASTAATASFALAPGWVGVQGGLAQVYPLPLLRGIAYHNPDWDWHSFDWDKDVADLDNRIGRDIDSNDPDLRAFQSHGAKLLMYQGWGDPLVAPTAVLDYRNAVIKTFAAKAPASKVDDFLRVFMLPGVAHCAGGPGPSGFDPLSAVRDWVEKGTAPQRLIAVTQTFPGMSPSGGPKISRPLCLYPRVARFSGRGDPNAAESFECSSGEDHDKR